MTEKWSRIAGLCTVLFVLLLAGCGAPAGSPPRVVVILSGDARLEKLEGLQAGLSELGYLEGENITLEIRNLS